MLSQRRGREALSLKKQSTLKKGEQNSRRAWRSKNNTKHPKGRKEVERKKVTKVEKGERKKCQWTRIAWRLQQNEKTSEGIEQGGRRDNCKEVKEASF